MEPKQKRRGNSLLLMIVAAALLACNLSRLRPASSNSPSNNDRGSVAKTTGSPPTGAFNPAGDPRKNLKDAFVKLQTAYPFRLTETTTLTSSSNANTSP